ncbi:unnamed protein product [Ambrosiozyma monospora]|uniref:Unnamed protein product n=1 Tax=Ambrosiozyma monospora TaxID=43982 RepID=A0ACB5U8U3_AMBMO|nr:unnamed protein product [Ambrosiozyma monospora]
MPATRALWLGRAPNGTALESLLAGSAGNDDSATAASVQAGAAAAVVYGSVGSGSPEKPQYVVGQDPVVAYGLVGSGSPENPQYVVSQDDDAGAGAYAAGLTGKTAGTILDGNGAWSIKVGEALAIDSTELHPQPILPERQAKVEPDEIGREARVGPVAVPGAETGAGVLVYNSEEVVSAAFSALAN